MTWLLILGLAIPPEYVLVTKSYPHPTYEACKLALDEAMSKPPEKGVIRIGRCKPGVEA